MDAERLFETLWNDPNHTGVELPRFDVNAILDSQYVVSPPKHLRGSDLWELEKRKARDPLKYIPSAVRSATTFDHATLPDGTETFVRLSEQRRWLAPDEYETVLERTSIDSRTRMVTFIGVAEAQRDDGSIVRATGGQPLFSVQHGVAGTEERPLNVWRIVHRTERRDERILARFAELASGTAGGPVKSVNAVALPEYITIFLEQDLGARVSSRG